MEETYEQMMKRHAEELRRLQNTCKYEHEFPWFRERAFKWFDACGYDYLRCTVCGAVIERREHVEGTPLWLDNEGNRM